MPLAPGIAGLQRRLLIPLLLALMFTVAISVLVNQRSAGDAALQQDQRLLRLLPLMSGSVVKSPTVRRPESEGPMPNPDDPRAGVLVLLAPPLVEFLEGAEGSAGYGVLNALGERLAGDPWLPVVLPSSNEPEFQSLEHAGVTYRLVAQRVQTDAGEVVVMLAAATDGRQRWLQNVLERVLLPNLLIFFVAAGLLLWGVNRALRPLMELRQAVENRSPRDLSPIEVRSAPLEVRPLVEALNRLFDLVNAQTQAQRRFVADAAHQLRTPLAGVQAQVEAWAQAARQLNGRDTVSLPVDQVRRLRDAARRTSQLANQLLALSRTDTLRLDDQPSEQIDLEALCEDVLAQQLDAAAAKSIDIGMQTVPPKPEDKAGCCANCSSTWWTTPSSTRPPVATSPCVAVPIRRAKCGWRWRTTDRASRLPSAAACCSASTGCPARWAKATAWAWPLPMALPARTARNCGLMWALAVWACACA